MKILSRGVFVENFKSPVCGPNFDFGGGFQPVMEDKCSALLYHLRQRGTRRPVAGDQSVTWPTEHVTGCRNGPTDLQATSLSISGTSTAWRGALAAVVGWTVGVGLRIWLVEVNCIVCPPQLCNSLILSDQHVPGPDIAEFLSVRVNQISVVREASLHQLSVPWFLLLLLLLLLCFPLSLQTRLGKPRTASTSPCVCQRCQGLVAPAYNVIHTPVTPPYFNRLQWLLFFYPR